MFDALYCAHQQKSTKILRKKAHTISESTKRRQAGTHDLQKRHSETSRKFWSSDNAEVCALSLDPNKRLLDKELFDLAIESIKSFQNIPALKQNLILLNKVM